LLAAVFLKRSRADTSLRRASALTTARRLTFFVIVFDKTSGNIDGNRAMRLEQNEFK
jgi:hypothetical protein